MPGCQAKGSTGGVDCVRFGAGFYDEMYGFKRAETARLPQDTALHSRKTAIEAMLLIRRLYMPNIAVLDGSIEPGDAIVEGPWGGGPGHLLIAGVEPFTLWEATRTGVKHRGMNTYQQIYRVYRQTDKHKWLSSLTQ